MRIKVYQIDAEKDSKGLGYEHDRKAMAHGRADPAIYQCVFHGDIDGTALDDVYDAFHTFNHPYTGTYQGRPISDSDVVEVTPEQPGKSPVEPGCYFRGGTGWEKIEFDTSQCAEMKGICHHLDRWRCDMDGAGHIYRKLHYALLLWHFFPAYERSRIIQRGEVCRPLERLRFHLLYHGQQRKSMGKTHLVGYAFCLTDSRQHT